MDRTRGGLPGAWDASRYADLIERIRAGRAGADEELYHLFAGGVRCLLGRAIGEARAKSEVRPLLLMIAQRLRQGIPVDPSHLPRLVRSAVRDRIRNLEEDSTAADSRVAGSDDHDPQQQFAKTLLQTMPPRDREILVRFYSLRQPVAQICRDLQVTAEDVEIVKANTRVQFDKPGGQDAWGHTGNPEPEDAVLRVLQVEDSESDAALVVRLLEKAGYTVRAQRVEDAAHLRDALSRQDWDIIIADHQLPQFDAPGALQVVQDAGRDIPFIVVSGNIGEEIAVSMMRSGAQDYILKGNLARLAPAVRRELGEAHSRRQKEQTARALRRHQEWMALAMNAAQIGAFDVCPVAGELILSESAKRQLGMAPDATPDYDALLGAIHPNDRRRVQQLIERALEPDSGGQFAAEYRTMGGAEGSERWLASAGRVLAAGPDRAPRLIGVTLDISERRRLQEDFRQLQNLESIGRVAGEVAHDFNNLLTVIGGGAQLIADGMGARDPLRGTMNDVLHAVNRAGDLTRHLLTFSRRHLDAPRPILLNALVRESEAMLRRVVGESIQLVLSLEEDAGLLRADPAQLRQVLLNLASNAQDAMPDGGRLSIATAAAYVDEVLSERRGVKPGHYLALSVADTGAGMSAEVRARMFEPFFTTKDGRKGAGLATVYGIVKRSEGAIWVQSQPGRGSTFTMLFPAIDPQRHTRPRMPAGSQEREPIPGK